MAKQPWAVSLFAACAIAGFRLAAAGVRIWSDPTGMMKARFIDDAMRI
jgi:hypothetical protein